MIPFISFAEERTVTVMIEFFDDKLKEKYYKLTHKSGLDVYVFPKKMTGSYALFGTKYGSVDNCFRIKGEESFTSVPDGIAHYLEHRMFTQKDGSDITERFSSYGADSNAYTSFNKTVYICSATDNFDDAVRTLLEFVTEPNFTDELVERERGIIIQEIKMTNDSPYSRSYRRMLEAMYHRNSARVDIAGTVESVSSITADMLNQCYKTFYNPTNMALVVCGDVDPQGIMKIVDEAIPDDFSGVDIERKYCEDEPKEVCKPLCEDYMEVSKPIFTIGVKDVDISGDPYARLRKFAAMSLLSELIFSRSGKLYNELLDSGMITPDFDSAYTLSETFAYTVIEGESDAPLDVVEYIKKYISEFSFSDEELERCKKVIFAEYVMDFDSTEEIANNLIDYVFENFDFFGYGHLINEITSDEIYKLIRDCFKDEYFAVSVIYPVSNGEKEG